MEENFMVSDLEDFTIKEKEYRAKKRKKILFITIPIVIVIIIAIVLAVVLTRKKGGKIHCIYETKHDSERAHLFEIITNRKHESYIYSLTIDNIDYGFYDQGTYFTFEKAGMHYVTIHYKKKLEHLNHLFSHAEQLVEADFSELNMEEVASMESLFYDCPNLKKVNFNNKTPNLKNINYMFCLCSSLVLINLNFDTSKITEIRGTFIGCEKLENLDLSNLKLDNLVIFSYMFSDCFKLKEIKFNNNTFFNNLEEIYAMFRNCKSLEHIDTRKFNDKKLKIFSYVFEGCESLKQINLSHFETKNLEQLSGTFQDCKSLESLDISNFDTSKVTEMDDLFNGCEELTYIDISNFKLDNVTTTEYMFANCYKLKEIKFNAQTLTKNLQNMGYMFYHCNSLENINLEIFKENNLTNLNNAFAECESLKSLDLSSFDFTKVENASNMFYNCVNLENLILPNDMASLKYTDYMFGNCFNLPFINLTFLQNGFQWESANGMFENCTGLNNIEIFIRNQVPLQSAEKMFKECINIKSINLEGLNNTNTFFITEMFYGCQRFGYLNIQNFNTLKDRNSANIFKEIPNNVTIVYTLKITSSNVRRQIQNLIKNPF